MQRKLEQMRIEKEELEKKEREKAQLEVNKRTQEIRITDSFLERSCVAVHHRFPFADLPIGHWFPPIYCT